MLSDKQDKPRRGRGAERKKKKSGEDKDAGTSGSSRSSSATSAKIKELFGEDSQGELFSDKFVIPRVSMIS